MYDVKVVAIHPKTEWLSSLTHILETTPPTLIKVNHIRCFARGAHLHNEKITSYVASECFPSSRIWTPPKQREAAPELYVRRVRNDVKKVIR